MITAEHEEVRRGAGAGFVDSVSLEFSHPEASLFGLARMTRRPSSERAHGRLLLFRSGALVEQLELEQHGEIDWRDANIDGIRLRTEAPLERWSLEAGGAESSMRLEARASTPARSLADEIAQAVGIERYEQVCEVEGEVTTGERTQTVHCRGRRVHAWGNPDPESSSRWRSLFAVTAAGRAISAAAALPPTSPGHDRELRYARWLDADDAPPFEEVRVSTVYDINGSPTKAGLELWMPGDELPRRLGGAAVCGTRIERDDQVIALSFFRWSIDDEPAYGSYEIIERQ
jgi:hypothetical protein